MVKVTVGNNVKRESVMVSEDTTLRSVLEANSIDYTRGSMTLDGSTLAPGDLDKSFAAFGIHDKCYLLNVVKADNACGSKAFKNLRKSCKVKVRVCAVQM